MFKHIPNPVMCWIAQFSLRKSERNIYVFKELFQEEFHGDSQSFLTFHSFLQQIDTPLFRVPDKVLGLQHKMRQCLASSSLQSSGRNK